MDEECGKSPFNPYSLDSREREQSGRVRQKLSKVDKFPIGSDIWDPQNFLSLLSFCCILRGATFTYEYFSQLHLMLLPSFSTFVMTFIVCLKHHE